MKYQALFSLKNNKIVLECRLLQICFTLEGLKLTVSTIFTLNNQIPFYLKCEQTHFTTVGIKNGWMSDKQCRP